MKNPHRMCIYLLNREMIEGPVFDLDSELDESPIDKTCKWAVKTPPADSFIRLNFAGAGVFYVPTKNISYISIEKAEATERGDTLPYYSPPGSLHPESLV